MAARVRLAPLGRPKWPLKLARLCQGARNRLARLLENTTPGDFPTSSLLGSAGALEMGARARSVPLGRSKWPLEPARLRWSARNGCSSLLGYAQAFEMAARKTAPTDVSDIERLKLPLEPARLCQGARNGFSNSLGSAEALDMAARPRSALLGLST